MLRVRPAACRRSAAQRADTRRCMGAPKRALRFVVRRAATAPIGATCEPTPPCALKPAAALRSQQQSAMRRALSLYRSTLQAAAARAQLVRTGHTCRRLRGAATRQRVVFGERENPTRLAAWARCGVVDGSTARAGCCLCGACGEPACFSGRSAPTDALRFGAQPRAFAAAAPPPTPSGTPDYELATGLRLKARPGSRAAEQQRASLLLSSPTAPAMPPHPPSPARSWRRQRRATRCSSRT